MTDDEVTDSKMPLTDPEGEGLADDLIGDDPEPIDGWIRFNEKGQRVDAEGRVILVPPVEPTQDLEED